MKPSNVSKCCGAEIIDYSFYSMSVIDGPDTSTSWIEKYICKDCHKECGLVLAPGYERAKRELQPKYGGQG